MQKIRPALKAALFDFDGTLSTLRYGWEEVMEPMMLEYIAGPAEPDEALRTKVRNYIDESTGIQTYFQMEWLAAQVKEAGRTPGANSDPWYYKAEYNRRLMERVSRRREDILSGRVTADEYLMKGSRPFLQALKERGIAIYVASGTDHADVNEETALLGLKDFFEEVAGAPPHRTDCSKEAVIRKLLTDNRLQGEQVAVFGDGKVEIRLGREAGAVTLGVASDEGRREGVNPLKRERLVRAGAHAIIGDFLEKDALLNLLNLV